MELFKNLKLLFPLFLVCGIIVFYFLELNELLSLDIFLNNYFKFKEFITVNPFSSYFIYILIYILVVSFSIPIASFLTICGGALFGWYALSIIPFAATFGSIIVFIAAKTVFYEFFKNKTSSFYKTLENGFKKNDVVYLLSLRLIPLVPFWVANVIPAFFNMKLNLYILATFFGILPGTFIYIWFSIGLEQILIEGYKPDFSIYNHPAILGSFTALGILILLPIFFKKKL